MFLTVCQQNPVTNGSDMIIKSSFELNEILDDTKTVGIYVADLNMYIQRQPVSDKYLLVDLTNAMLPSKVCQAYRFRKTKFDNTSIVVTNLIKQHTGNDLAKLFDLASKLDWNSCMIFTMRLTENIFIDKELLPSNRVFTPFRTPPPLNARPSTWNMKHVYMALLNGQYRQLDFNTKYTQNYDDVTSNYDLLAKDLVKDVKESPSGWNTRIDRDGTVHVNYYSTNTNSFQLHI